MSSPRFEPWLIPDTISCGWNSIKPSVAKRTQSTGVPSVANPDVPSPNSISSTQSGRRVVIERAVALRFVSGAITASSMAGTSSSARRIACRPLAWMPSSLVSRTFKAVQSRVVSGRNETTPACERSATPATVVADALEIKPVGGCRLGGGASRRPVEQFLEALDAEAPAPDREHRPHEHANHVAHERVRLDPEGEHVLGLAHPLGAEDIALEPHVVGLGWSERGEVVRPDEHRRTSIERRRVERARDMEGIRTLERRRHRSAQDPVSIRPRARVPARVEPIRSPLGYEHPDVGG